MVNNKDMRKTFGKWTSEEEQLLRSLSKNKVPLSEIMKKLDRTKEALRTKASKLVISLGS